jgi:inner membrane protein involved in colicin E2 resistance
MIKRIVAIVFIFICTSVAWGILGATIFARTQSSRNSLTGPVASTWGTAHEQGPATAVWDEWVSRTVETVVDGKKTTRTSQERVARPLPLESTRLNVDLDLEHRQKGLVWYSTYKVALAGVYGFRNTTSEERVVRFTLPFPAAKSIYDDMNFTLDGQPLAFTTREAGATASAPVAAGKTVLLGVGYRSQGLGSWRYKLGGEVAQVRDFTLRVKTNFRGVDFAEDTLSPTMKRETARGWELDWSYRNLVSGVQIGLTMPEKLQPRALAGEISFFAPVSLFFFFFLMLILTTLRGIDLHPMNYFFLAAAFFAFHLLLAYLVDHISIHWAFVICSAVSVFLVISYLRLVVGMRFAAVEAGIAQVVYLVLFSYAFFFEGFTGLAITIGAIVTLFAVMQMTGRIRWGEKFSPSYQES